MVLSVRMISSFPFKSISVPIVFPMSESDTFVGGSSINGGGNLIYGFDIGEK